MEGAADQDENAGQPILQNILEGKAERDGADAKAGEDVDRLHRGQDDCNDDQEAEKQNGPVSEACKDVAEIVSSGPAQYVLAGKGYRVSDSKKEQRHDQRHDQVRQDVEETGDPGINPFVEHAQGFVHGEGRCCTARSAAQDNPAAKLKVPDKLLIE
jgi:hypothetical protein